MSIFPDPSLAPIVTRNRRRVYATPDGEFPSVTTINKTIGLGTEGLIAWSASLERAACLEAAVEVYAEGDHEDGPSAFKAAVEARIGTAKQHQLALNRAADIGTAIHGMVQWHLRGELGLERGPEPELAQEARWGFDAWKDWWKSSGLKVVATEQPIWDKVGRYAGTIDIIAEDSSGSLLVVDTKSSKAIYDEHHVQVSAYINAARNWAPIKEGLIVRVPKVATDKGFETKWLGTLQDRKVSEADLFRCFMAARTLYAVLVEKP